MWIENVQDRRDVLISNILQIVQSVERGRLPRSRLRDVEVLKRVTAEAIRRNVLEPVSAYGSRVLTPKVPTALVFEDIARRGFSLEEAVIVLGYDIDVSDASISPVKYVPVMCRARITSISPRSVGLNWRVREYCTAGRLAKIGYPVFGNVLPQEDMCINCREYEQCGGTRYQQKKAVKERDYVPTYLLEISVEAGEATFSSESPVQCLALPYVVNELMSIGEGTVVGVFIDREVTRKGYTCTEPILLIFDILNTKEDVWRQYRNYLAERGYVLVGDDATLLDINIVAESICPELVGVLPQKILALLQAVGAYSTVFRGVDSAVPKRCTIHELHIGTTGTGKSTMYLMLRTLVKKGIYTILRSSSLAGLFISGKDEIRFGGAVIASSRDPRDFGLLVLDEVDTVRELERDESDIASMLLTFMEQGVVSRDISGRHVEVRGLNCAVTMIANMNIVRGRRITTLADLLPPLFLTGKGKPLLDRIDIVVIYPPPRIEDIERYIDRLRTGKKSVEASPKIAVEPEALYRIIENARRTSVELSDEFLDRLKERIRTIADSFMQAGLQDFLSYRTVDKIVRLCTALAKLEYAIGRLDVPMVLPRHLDTVENIINAMFSGVIADLAGESPFMAIPESLKSMCRGLPYPRLGMLVLQLLNENPDGLTIRELCRLIRERCEASSTILHEILYDLGISSLENARIREAVRTVLERLNERGDVYKVSGMGDDAKYRIVQ